MASGDRRAQKNVLLETLDALAETDARRSIEAVVVSGDLTNRSRPDGFDEFAAHLAPPPVEVCHTRECARRPRQPRRPTGSRTRPTRAALRRREPQQTTGGFADGSAGTAATPQPRACDRGHYRRSEWLKAHPHWSFVFTPTHASWLNQVVCLFGILCRRLLEHGHVDTPEDLAEQMLAYTETRNQAASPFQWTYGGRTVLNA
jgi:hypothetical protein